MSDHYSFEVYNSLLQKTGQSREEIEQLKLKKKHWQLEKRCVHSNSCLTGRFLLEKLTDLESRPVHFLFVLTVLLVRPPKHTKQQTLDDLDIEITGQSTGASVSTGLGAVVIPPNPTLTTLPTLSAAPLTIATLRDADDRASQNNSSANNLSSSGHVAGGKPNAKRKKSIEPGAEKKKVPKKGGWKLTKCFDEFLFLEKAPRAPKHSANQDAQGT